MKTFVIAEAGSCHDGIYEKAVDLINVARDAGADACKFQYWSDAGRLAQRRQAAKYLPIYAQYQMPRQWLSSLSIECHRRGLEFMCTTYLPEDIAVVEPYVRRFKIASFEAGDTEFIKEHFKYGKPTLVSTGMNAAPPIGPIILLHCVSAYPTPIDEANLAAIRLEGYGRAYEGFSDHTASVYAGAFAVCAGARIVETHIRLDSTSVTNPDAATALLPDAYTEYVHLIRTAERMLGDGQKRLMPCEADMAQYKVLV
jgi:sialic acid synthase SpsE